MKTVYSVTFNDGDGYRFSLFSNARKALTFARGQTKTIGTPQEHIVELNRLRDGSLIFFYTQEHKSFTVAKEFIV